MSIKIPTQEVLDLVKAEFVYDPDAGTLTRTTKYMTTQIKKHTVVNGHDIQ